MANDLVVYTKFNGDISTAVQKTASLEEMRPENRIAVPGGLYVATCHHLEIKPAGMKGILLLKYYREMIQEEEVRQANSLPLMTIKKFFPGRGIKPDIIHEGKNYAYEWGEDNSEISGWNNWIIAHGKADTECLGLMKAELIKDKQVLVSNDFLSALFGPVIDSLLVIYRQMAQF